MKEPKLAKAVQGPLPTGGGRFGTKRDPTIANRLPATRVPSLLSLAMLYADARGVCRAYEMSLEDGVWKIWGQSGPVFFQRFSAEFSPDGNTISGRWEVSRDRSTWETDFDVEYSKIA
jgi:hypothetical protein